MLFIFFAVLATALANPILINEPKPMTDGISNFFSVDFSIVATTAEFKCLLSNNYKIAYVRAYSADGQGTFDSNSITNLNNAYKANIATEVYISPQPLGKKTGAQQLSETYNGLVKGGVKVNRIWLQVFNPKLWDTNQDNNAKFIQSYVDQLSVLGISGGIYTTQMDWYHIAHHYTGAYKLQLWYSTAYGPGLTNESSPNFDDFFSFGGWVAPTTKQFALAESVCGIYPVNRDIVALAIPVNKLSAKEEGPVVEKAF